MMRLSDFEPRTEVDTSTIGDDAYGDLPAPMHEPLPEPDLDLDDDDRGGMAVVAYAVGALLLLVIGALNAAIWWWLG
jgi:hypothetical protein